MRKICVINQKGGVAKTTTTINIASGLSRLGKRVLIIDLDPQGSVSTCLGVRGNSDLFDLMMEEATLEHCIVPVATNLDALTSKETLTKAELILAGEQS